MPLTQLVHMVSERKLGRSGVLRALDDIRRHHRLMCGDGPVNWYGRGIYAYFAGQVPDTARGEVLVVFEIDEALVRTVGPPNRRHAFIRVPPLPASPYVPIVLRGFVHPPPGYESDEYAGPPVL